MNINAVSQFAGPNFRLAHAAEWNVDIQRAITNNLALDVAYVANHGFNEQYFTDLNQPAVGAGWAGAAATGLSEREPGAVL